MPNVTNMENGLINWDENNKNRTVHLKILFLFSVLALKYIKKIKLCIYT